MYRIKYRYWTGDSFHNEDGESILEYEWNDLSVAKECLLRIKEHYKWYEDIERAHYYHKNEISKPKWFNVTCKYKHEEHHLINLRLDNEKEIQFRAPWCGYFEGLYGAEIVVDDRDMKFEF